MKMKLRSNIYALTIIMTATLAACGSGNDSTSDANANRQLTIITDYPALEGLEHSDTVKESIEESTSLSSEEKAFALSSLDALGVPLATDGIERSAINAAVIDPNFSIDDSEKFFTLDTVNGITVTRTDINDIYAGLTLSNGAPTYRNAKIYASMMATTNERSFPILTDGRGSHAAIASRFYSGRTAFFSKDNWLIDMANSSTQTSGEKIFYKNLLNWLTFENPNGYKNKLITNTPMNVWAMPGTISTMTAIPNLAVTVKELPANVDAGDIDPAVYPLLIITEAMTDEQIDVLKNYLANGGAILGSRNLWSLSPGIENKNLYGIDIMKYPYIKFMKEAGAEPIQNALMVDGLFKGYPLLPTMNVDHVSIAYPPDAAEATKKVIEGQAISSIKGLVGNNDEDKFIALSTITGRLMSSNPDNLALQSLSSSVGQSFAQKLAQGKVDCNINIYMCAIQRTILENTKPSVKITAHPAATQYPGLSQNSSSSIKTVFITDKIDGTGYARPSTWISTDRWINAGQVVKISLPTNYDSKLDVIIGAQNDFLAKSGNAIQYLERMPKISWRIKLQPGLNKIATPAGGNIFLVATEKLTGKTTPVTIEQAIAVPHFVLGTSDPAKFMTDVKASDVPYIEFESNRFRLIIPNSSGKSILDPVKLANGWDQQMTWTDELLGHSAPTVNDIHQSISVKHVIVLDKQISAGWMHANYPIMYPDVLPIRNDIANVNNPNGIGTGWGDPHEYGHNFQTQQITNERNLISLPPLFAYNFAPNRDISNNLLALHHQFKRKQVDRLTVNGDYATAWAFLSKSNRDFSQVGFWDGLTFFSQYNLRYGWEFHTAFFRKYREHAYNVKRDPDISKVSLKLLHTDNPSLQDQYDAFALFASKASGYDQRENLAKWGIPISANVNQAIAAWRYPSDDKITQLRNDCTTAKLKDSSLVCIQPGDSSLPPMMTDRPVAIN
jgi:Peptidase M60, enhancin and enhancin-like/N-terminal domain of M60-like peptidases